MDIVDGVQIDCGTQGCKGKIIFYPDKHFFQCQECGTIIDGTSTIAAFRFCRDHLRANDSSLKEIEKNKKIAHITLTYTRIDESKQVESVPIGNININSVDIYKTAGNTPISVYYGQYGDKPGKYSNGFPRIYAELIFVQRELPEIHYRSYSGAVTVPVKGPDSLVYTGATVGGVTTGGFHVQEGQTHWETVQIGTGGISQELKYSLDRYPLVSDVSRFEILCDVPERIKKINSEEYPRDILKELISDTMSSDEEMYIKACRLYEAVQNSKKSDARKYDDYDEIIKLFEQLGEYKDSRVKKELCKHEKAEKREAKESQNNIQTYLMAFGALLVIVFPPLIIPIILIGIIIIVIKKIKNRKNKEN